MQKLETKSSISLDDHRIYHPDFAVVKASDVKPNFNNTGTQMHTRPDPQIVQGIAKNFDL